MDFTRAVARFNRRLVNPVQRLWAPWLKPFALVVHTGRVSGREYRTPVFAFRSGEHLAIVPLYGEDSDWLRNLLAAGSGVVVRSGRRGPYTELRVVRPDDGDVTGFARRLAGTKRKVLLGHHSWTEA